jgi:hypothetical protein
MKIKPINMVGIRIKSIKPGTIVNHNIYGYGNVLKDHLNFGRPGEAYSVFDDQKAVLYAKLANRISFNHRYT